MNNKTNRSFFKLFRVAATIRSVINYQQANKGFAYYFRQQVSCI